MSENKDSLAGGQALLAVTNAEEMPQRIVVAALEWLDADDASLMLPGPDGTLRLAYSSRIPKEEWPKIRIPLGGSIAGKVARTGEPILLRDPPDRSGKARSSIVYPVLSGQEVLGVLNLSRTRGQGSFGQDDLVRAKMLASSVQLALENSILVRRMVEADRQAMLFDLTAGIAHEINTPTQYCLDSVAFLKSAFEALVPAAQKASESDEDLRFLIESAPMAFDHIDEGLAQIQSVVSQVKQTAEHGRKEKGAFDVNAELKDLLAALGPSIEPVAGVEAKLDGVLLALGDPSDFSKAMGKLIDNARQAIERTQGRGRITVRTAQSGGEILIEVADTGAGIAEQIAPRIFHPFFTTQEVGKGRGLGLTIAHSIIVERNGGKLSFDSTEGEGTTFYVRFPAARGP